MSDSVARSAIVVGLTLAALLPGCAGRQSQTADPVLESRRGEQVGMHYFNRTYGVAVTRAGDWQPVGPQLTLEGPWTRVWLARGYGGAVCDLSVVEGLQAEDEEVRLGELERLALARPGYEKTTDLPGWWAPAPFLGRRVGIRRVIPSSAENAKDRATMLEGMMLLAVRDGQGFTLEVTIAEDRFADLPAGAFDIISSFRAVTLVEDLGKPVPEKRHPPAKEVIPPPVKSYAYMVRAGDTLGTIARRETGDTRNWKEIARLNELDESAQLSIGQELRIPEALRSARREAAPRGPRKRAGAFVDPKPIMGAGAESASVFDQPGSGGKLVARLPKGAPLTPIGGEERPGWIKISLPGGGSGWISSLDVRIEAEKE